eukprot:303471-Pelagomonas_calceolata.AAC.2
MGICMVARHARGRTNSLSVILRQSQLHNQLIQLAADPRCSTLWVGHGAFVQFWMSNSQVAWLELCCSLSLRHLAHSGVPDVSSSVRNMPHLLSTTSLFYISTSLTGCPV